jgi:hypothetical protein
VTADRTVYTFTLRPGLRYSTGRPVRPQDFRYALERVLDLNPAAASFLDGIAGAAACVPGKLCNLDRGVTVNDPAGTVTFRLTAPDPDFLDKLAFEFTAPVPAYIPARDIGRDPVPGTGPYVVIGGSSGGWCFWRGRWDGNVLLCRVGLGVPRQQEDVQWVRVAGSREGTGGGTRKRRGCARWCRRGTRSRAWIWVSGSRRWW